MKKKITIIIVLIILVFFTVFLNKFLLRSQNDIASEFKTTTVVRRDIGSTIMATGIIKPMVGAEVKVGSRISGIVKKLRVNIGDFVKKGQIIAEIDEPEYKAILNQSIAALKSAQAEYEYAKMNFERQSSLLKQNFISQQQYDLAENSLKVTEAKLNKAEADVEYEKVQVSYTKIYSPISGVIGSISTQEGEAVAARFAAPTFMTIIDLTRLEVHAYVDETDIGRIEVGQEAIFTVDTYQDAEFKGKVTAIYPKAVIKDNVVNYIAIIQITDFQEKTLRPEMTTFATIFLEKRKDVVVVPTRAVRRERGENFVSVLDGKNIVKRGVTVGWKDDGYTEIISGLNEGEEVVVSESNKENKR